MSDVQEYLREQGIGAETLDDIVHDAASEMASGVNNDGLDAQLEFLHLKAAWDPEEILQAVKEAQL